MKHYHQLTQEQRYGINTLLKTGHNKSEIAEVIGVHKSTISREVKRNRGKRGYRYKQAQTMAKDRRQGKVRLLIDGSTWAFIESLIEEDWSPEQIHGWMKANMEISVSHEWIYQYILRDKQSGGSLHQHLRCRKKRPAYSNILRSSTIGLESIQLWVTSPLNNMNNQHSNKQYDYSRCPFFCCKITRIH